MTGTILRELSWKQPYAWISVVCAELFFIFFVTGRGEGWVLFSEGESDFSGYQIKTSSLNIRILSFSP